MGWIGVDLDGTLAEYYEYRGPSHIGKPIPKMVNRVKKWISEGKDVQILTARVHPKNPGKAESEIAISVWTKKVFGRALRIRSDKDLNMIELWDDRCIQVVPNTGERVDGKD